jgi:hypothetical protein
LEPSDLVWVHLRKDRFPDLRKSKLMPRACYRHNLTGPKDGPRASWAEGKHGNSLQIGFCANVSRARIAMYLRIV